MSALPITSSPSFPASTSTQTTSSSLDEDEDDDDEDQTEAQHTARKPKIAVLGLFPKKQALVRRDSIGKAALYFCQPNCSTKEVRLAVENASLIVYVDEGARLLLEVPRYNTTVDPIRSEHGVVGVSHIIQDWLDANSD